jgi:RNA recognition motif-containing protein
MAIKLFIGGLAYSVNDDQLRDMFASVGTKAGLLPLTKLDPAKTVSLALLVVARTIDVTIAVEAAAADVATKVAYCSTNVRALPARPARPARPIRWT